MVCILLTSLTSEPELATIEGCRIHPWEEVCILTSLTGNSRRFLKTPMGRDMLAKTHNFEKVLSLINGS